MPCPLIISYVHLGPPRSNQVFWRKWSQISFFPCFSSTVPFCHVILYHTAFSSSSASFFAHSTANTISALLCLCKYSLSARTVQPDNQWCTVSLALQRVLTRHLPSQCFPDPSLHHLLLYLYHAPPLSFFSLSYTPTTGYIFHPAHGRSHFEISFPDTPRYAFLQSLISTAFFSFFQTSFQAESSVAATLDSTRSFRMRS